MEEYFVVLAAGAAACAVVYLLINNYNLRRDLRAKVGDVNATSKTLNEKHAELLQTNERLQNLLHLKTDFVSIASHQLRTPLTDVKWGLLYVLDKRFGMLDKELETHLHTVLDNVNRMNHLINELLDFVASEEGTAGERADWHDLEAIIDRTIDKVTEHFRGKEVTLTRDFRFGSQLVFVDGELIEIAFVNLISNAFQYTPDGKTISVSTKQKGNQFYFEVKDEGVGIPSDKQEVIFTRFKRSPAALKMNASGIGIGLHITKNIVEGMGGTIGFKSGGDEQGATFYFTIPLTTEEEKGTS